ncbi:hypothetical protein [Carboxylicivirga sp. N1Y90]|uniref:hypothetical protein n=1 Tax=Carboxylicivirga fragile TaxID=3417571 RepID=UPI003D34269B|nr:hypothetical protein [Marinilabiliaceae bacterium N1Y90]
MVYKSYKFTTIVRCVIPFVFPLAIGLNLTILNDLEQEPPIEMTHMTLIMALGLAYFIIQTPIKLRYVEASEDGLLVKDFKRETLIEYKQIEWVTKFDFTSPWFITIKYKDTRSGESKKVAYFLDKKEQQLFGDDKMTAFIKSRMKIDNPWFKPDDEPSMIKNLIILVLYAIPFVLTAIYVLKNF